MWDIHIHPFIAHQSYFPHLLAGLVTLYIFICKYDGLDRMTCSVPLRQRAH